MSILDIDSGYLYNIKQDLNLSIFEAARLVSDEKKAKVTLTIEFAKSAKVHEGIAPYETEADIDYNIKVTTQETPYQNKDYTATLAISLDDDGIVARRADGQISVFDEVDDE